MNVFAAAAVRAILKQPSSWAEQERTLNRERRKDLFHRLSALPGAAVLPSCANFLLFRLSGAPSGLASLLLKKHGCRQGLLQLSGPGNGRLVPRRSPDSGRT